MNRWLVFVTFLTSACATVGPSSQEFKCSVVGGHGVYAHFITRAVDLPSAEEYAEKVRQQLIALDQVPDNTFISCGDEF